ncbi:MAG: ROK family protein [bacterium]
MMYWGFDIGGTKIAAGIVKNNKIIKKLVIVHHLKRGRKYFDKTLNTIIDDLLVFGKPKGVGIGVKGIVSQKEKTIKSEVLKGINIVALIKKKVGNVKIKIDNDASTFTLYESVFGKAKKENYVFGLTLGTGIGTGFTIDNKIYRDRGYVLELGHMIIQVDGRKLNGRQGTLEIYSSGSGIEDAYLKRYKKRKKSRQIFADARNKSSKDCAIVKEGAEYLGIGLVNIINIFHPDCIVIGGGLSENKWYIELAKKEIKKRIKHISLGTKVIITSNQLNSAIIGPTLLLTHG